VDREVPDNSSLSIDAQKGEFHLAALKGADWRLEANLNRKANGLALEGPFCGTLRTFVGI